MVRMCSRRRWWVYEQIFRFTALTLAVAVHGGLVYESGHRVVIGSVGVERGMAQEVAANWRWSVSGHWGGRTYSTLNHSFVFRLIISQSIITMSVSETISSQWYEEKETERDWVLVVGFGWLWCHKCLCFNWRRQVWRQVINSTKTQIHGFSRVSMSYYISRAW